MTEPPVTSSQPMPFDTEVPKRPTESAATGTASASPIHPLRRAWTAIGAGTLLVLSKAKLLLLGLTKLSTLSSLLLFLGIYWQLWGWPFALGFVFSIYVHEMGHVAALARYGIAASAPMFIPGLGAFVRLKQYPADVRQDARVGLAGPVWGLGAALVAYGAFLMTHAPMWGAIAQTGGYLNLFNLIPVWQLDGGRGFRSLSRPERWLTAGALGATWLVTHQGLLILLAAAAVYRALRTDAPRERDWQTLACYVGLIIALSWMSELHVSTAGLATRH
jgi:Zn-dependent protease